MKTVQDYLDLGLVFVGGDKICGITGDSSSRKLNIFDRSICAKQYNKGAAKIGADCYARARWTPSSFAWRNNDGVKPEYSGDKEIELRNGKVKLTSSLNSDDNEDWPILCASSDIVKWRPVVLQSASTKEDKPMKQFKTNQEVNEIVAAHIDSMKPVYTAEMHAKGELPPVGSEVKVCIEEAGFELEGNDPKHECKVVTVKAAFVNKDGEKIAAIENDKGNCACYIIECLKPIIKTIKVNGFDVPAPMSENIKGGDRYFFPAPAIERYFQHTYWDGGDFDKLNLARGTIHKTQDAAIAHAKAMLGIDPNA